MKDEHNGELREAQPDTEEKPVSNDLPRRYRLYDKIKLNVSLRTIDIIIITVSIAIIALLIYGIITGNPQ